ncbi:DUF1302 domain-containing protein [Pseudoduganella namucuonensis]|uniref:DUF1302 family protein n=1 Tax=Pseudoduganella namucuonensis TaxID=1035707 RepID=A0A1I7LDV4_9BURK|nr:DUF1302 family protein [Pseudoduganella namucuonensis]SFV07863.1 Protein of unknown function [Pseudoduganella namucuonensis]
MKKFTPQRRTALSAALLALAATQDVLAAELVNNDSYTIRWDNTLKYSVGQRVTGPAAAILANPNTNDGDYSFARGDLVTNRADILSEFDYILKDKANTGVSVSAAAWYDRVYNRSHRPIPLGQVNSWSVPNDQFTSYVRDVNGRRVELLNAFVHSGFDIGEHNLSFRLGRHTLLWGESLLLASNGIAAGMGPVDAMKALSLPGATTKEIFMPVNQLSAAFSLTPQWDIAAYHQFEYRETRVPGPGSYFSTGDLVFQGGERINAVQGLPFGNIYIERGADIKAPDSKGQWGIAAKYRDADAGRDFGFYYLRYSDKTPQVYTQITAAPGGLSGFIAGGATIGNYFFLYPQKIELAGASFATLLGDANVSGEISVRHNLPLMSVNLNVAPGAIAVNGTGNFLHAVGDTLHAQVSWIKSFGPSGLWDAADFVGEIGGHRLMKVTRNEAFIDPTRVRKAFGTGMTFEPKWYQPLPGMDLTMPVNVSWNFSGPSVVDPAFAGGAAHGGSVSLGLKFTYEGKWRGGVNYTRYTARDGASPYLDRDYVAANVSYSF